MKRMLCTFVLVCSWAGMAQAQVAVAPMQVTRQQFFNGTGAVLNAGCVNFFATGTSTPQAIYADSTGGPQLANPLTLDSTGSASVWMTNTAYDIVMNTGVIGTACSVSVGTQLWKEVNKNPFSIINGGANYIVASGTSDPSGSAGMLAYRSDIPCLRGFTTIWDCFATLTGIQILTNKTITAPAITNPTVTTGTFATPSLSSPSLAVGTPLTVTYPNYGIVGTTLNFLAIFDISASSGVTVKNFCSPGCGVPVNAGVIGICISNCGATGNAQIAVSGQTSCAFDGSTTVGDYVAISQTAAGKCTDAGATYPTATQGQVLGRAFSTNVGAGTYPIELYTQPEVKLASGVPVTAVNTTTLAANISSTPISTPSGNGFFRFSCYLVVTQAATTSSTLPACNVIYTDADSSIAETIQQTATNTANTLGTVGFINTSNGGIYGLYAKTGVSISYSTSGYASVGGTPMQYAIHIRLEGPF